MLRFLKVGAPLKKTVKSFLNRPLRCHNQTQYEFSFVRGYASWWKGSGDGDDNDNDDGDDEKKNNDKKGKAANYKKVVRTHLNMQLETLQLDMVSHSMLQKLQL